MNNPNMPGGFNSYGNQGQGYGNPQNMRFQSNIPNPEYQPRMSLYNIPQQELRDSLMNRATIGVEQRNKYHNGQVDDIPNMAVENTLFHMENRLTYVPGCIPSFDTKSRVINPANPQISPQMNPPYPSQNLHAYINPAYPHINPQMNPPYPSQNLHASINPTNPQINPQMNPPYPSQNLHASYTQSQLPSFSPGLSQREVYIPETIPPFETQRPTINNSSMYNAGPIPTNFASTHQASMINIQQDQYNICCNCREPTDNLISLNCSHKWCTECLKRVCMENSFQYEFIECICKARMKREYFIKSFGGEYQLSKLEDDYYTQLNSRFKPEPANPIPNYPQESNSYPERFIPSHPATNSYPQPSIPRCPQASNLYSQAPASNSYSQSSIPSYPQASNSYSQSSGILNNSDYKPAVIPSNSISSLHSSYQQDEYIAVFICGYCKNSISDENNRITLDCDHKICKTCLNTQITIQRSNYINPICMFDNSQISKEIISANLFPFLQTIETFRQYLPHTN
jgi:hypothetical protein